MSGHRLYPLQEAAFFQQRSKLKAGVFDDLFHSLVLSVESLQSPKTFNGLRLLAASLVSFYFFINLINSSISGGNSDAGFPAATSVIHVAYTMYEVLSAEANS